MNQRGFKGIVLISLLLLAVVFGFPSVLAKTESSGSVEVPISTDIKGGFIYVLGKAIKFLGNLGVVSSTTAPGAPNVLLLHGTRFSAQTWQDLGTISLLVGAGYRVVAVDLHMYSTYPPRDVLLERICYALGMSEANPTVIVSPSMSGSFSVPLLLRNPRLFAGYVPVAPGIAGEHSTEEFAAVTGVPALIVYGEKDSMGARVSNILSAIPGSHLVMIEGAGHPAYLDEPDLFHEYLLEFLKNDVFQEEKYRGWL